MFDLFRMYKPKWLYESLPYIYIAAGVLTILLLWNFIAMFSGGMLIAAGATVWSIRQKYRKEPPARQAAGPKKNENGLVRIVWRPGFNSGHKTIDDQHQALFADANKLVDAITKRQPSAIINESMRELARNIQSHFKTEEAILEKLAPGIAAPHKALHTQLLAEMTALAERVVQKTATPSELIGFITFDVITNHIVREDAKFFPAISAAQR